MENVCTQLLSHFIFEGIVHIFTLLGRWRLSPHWEILRFRMQTGTDWGRWEVIWKENTEKSKHPSLSSSPSITRGRKHSEPRPGPNPEAAAGEFSTIQKHPQSHSGTLGHLEAISRSTNRGEATSQECCTAERRGRDLRTDGLAFLTEFIRRAHVHTLNRLASKHASTRHVCAADVPAPNWERAASQASGAD